VNAYQIYQEINPSLISEIFNWIRDHERQLYKTALANLAASRNLRPIFVEKKSVPDQIAFLHKTLKLRTSDTIGEHLLQVWFMKEKKELLIAFCDGMGIEHDGEGSVEGSLPEALDDQKLQSTIEALLSEHDALVVSLYLRIFNLQTASGWENLAQILDQDQRLSLN